MADVTMDFAPTKDAGIDGSGEHHSRGADTQIRVGKGTTNSGEFGIYAFDTTAIQSFITTNLGGMTLQQAINLGNIKVNFSVVCSGPGDPIESPDHPVGLMDVYTDSNWVEGPGPSQDPGNDTDYNWVTGPSDLTPAATLDSPFDYYGAVMSPTGGGAWTNTKDGYLNSQQLKNIPGTTNSTGFGTWVTNERNSVPLDDNLWAEYIFGVDSSTGQPSPYATNMLKTYCIGGWDDNEINPNILVYTREDNAPSHTPLLSVTIVGTNLYIHAHDGDSNNDGACNVVDLGVLAKYYDSTGLPTSAVDPYVAGSWQKADFNNDGNVNVVDLGILAKNYDWVGDPAVPTPEPMTLSLLAVGGLALIRRRK
jgi:hypothetical protein